jgi:hypothetical protein
MEWREKAPRFDPSSIAMINDREFRIYNFGRSLNKGFDEVVNMAREAISNAKLEYYIIPLMVSAGGAVGIIQELRSTPNRGLRFHHREDGLIGGGGGSGARLPAKIAEKLQDTNLFQEVQLRKGVDKVGQLPGGKAGPFWMSDEEIEFATRMKKVGAQVFRSKGGANVGDFVVVRRGKVYAVELGKGKTQ